MKSSPTANHEKSDLAILVVSCDAYHDLWSPFFYCFFKYWPDCPYPVYLGSNSLSYPDERIRSILVGPDISYSSNLIDMLRQIPQNWIILWVDDRVLGKPVDNARVTSLVDWAKANGVGYIKLIGSHPLSTVQDPVHGIGEIPRCNRYRVSITVALWRKDLLRSLLLPGETAWQIERRGSKRSWNLTAKFLYVSAENRANPPLVDVHLLIKGRIIRSSYKFLEREQTLTFLQKRLKQSLLSHMYIKIYVAFYDLLVHLRVIISRIKA